MAIGFDAGTYNLVRCVRDDSNGFQFSREVNAFIKVKLENRFVFNMLKNSGVPLIERGDVAFALGEAAVNMAYTMTDMELQRPMKDGCVNPKETSAFEIMSIMIHSLIEGSVKRDGQMLYYSVPANAINEETDSDYHGKLLQAIFNAFESEQGYKVSAHPINEALALIYAELASKAYTGVSASFGAGMINVCFAIYGVPVFQFALTNSGDWIDRMAAKACGESVAFINKEKTKINLSNPPETLVERAIQTQYRIMVEKAVMGIKKGLEDSGKKVRTDNGIDIIIAGGTSMPNGFDTLFKEVVSQADLPMKIATIVRPVDPLYSVARGCLIAAENAAK